MRNPAAILTAILLATAGCSAAEAGGSKLVPAPAFDTPSTAAVETAVLAGGCFWGVEGVFEHVKGVKSVVSGYAGGTKADATYAKVVTERTGHAEAVRITYDPKQVSYGTPAADLFLGRARPDPAQPPGPRHRPQLPLGDFPADRRPGPRRPRLHRPARRRPGLSPADRHRLERGPFFAAEKYHQDFMRRNPWPPVHLGA